MPKLTYIAKFEVEPIDPLAFTPAQEKAVQADLAERLKPTPGFRKVRVLLCGDAPEVLVTFNARDAYGPDRWKVFKAELKNLECPLDDDATLEAAEDHLRDGAAHALADLIRQALQAGGAQDANVEYIDVDAA